MIAFLLTMTVLGGLIFAGYRSSIYLYGRGALEARSNDTQSAGTGAVVDQAGRMAQWDYRMSYSRIVLIVSFILMLLIVVGLLFAVFMALHGVIG